MANVDHILALNKNKKSVDVFREIPIDLDVALLAAFDSNPINQPEYNSEREEHLKRSARDAIQVLVNKLFNLPTSLTEEGVAATLPTTGPVTILPRSKRLPKPQPLTKWEKFAKEKGIAPKPSKDKLVFDEEKQEWVNRWGWKGKNKDEERAWIREVKASEETDGGGLVKGSTTLTKKLEVRAAKIAQHASQSKAQAQQKVQEQAERKQKVEELLVSTKKSTASLGKFDKKFVNEPKPKGVKRKFEPTEQPAKLERKSQMEIVEQLAKNPTAFKEKVVKKFKKSTGTQRPGDQSEGDKNNTKGTTNRLVNSRKAIRHLTNGVGPTALESNSHKKSKKRP